MGTNHGAFEALDKRGRELGTKQAARTFSPSRIGAGLIKCTAHSGSEGSQVVERTAPAITNASDCCSLHGWIASLFRQARIDSWFQSFGTRPIPWTRTPEAYPFMSWSTPTKVDALTAFTTPLFVDFVECDAGHACVVLHHDAELCSFILAWSVQMGYMINLCSLQRVLWYGVCWHQCTHNPTFAIAAPCPAVPNRLCPQHLHNNNPTSCHLLPRL